ncbi:MAG: transposase [Thermodesulfobacteriota bacterium]
MPRIARAVAVGYPHHVTQRGNYRMPVFDDEDDYNRYLDWLKDYSVKYDTRIWAYCLMTNHVHFICVPDRPDSLAKTFNTLHMRYSQYYNRKKEARGHLWQGRFFSCALDEEHLFAAVRYVENNPVRAGIVRKARRYPWSSAAGHIEKGTDEVLSRGLHLEKKIKGWEDYLKDSDDESAIETIRKSTLTGRPCGDDRFVEKIEGTIGRILKALPRGRPKKK